MEYRIEKFTVNGYEATVIIPSEPNGEWLWKTEFFYAFDKAEKSLCEKGFLRAYFSISEKIPVFKRKMRNNRLFEGRTVCF